MNNSLPLERRFIRKCVPLNWEWYICWADHWMAASFAFAYRQVLGVCPCVSVGWCWGWSAARRLSTPELHSLPPPSSPALYNCCPGNHSGDDNETTGNIPRLQLVYTLTTTTNIDQVIQYFIDNTSPIQCMCFDWTNQRSIDSLSWIVP